MGGSEDISEEVTFELIFDRHGGVGHRKLQRAGFCQQECFRDSIDGKSQKG